MRKKRDGGRSNMVGREWTAEEFRELLALGKEGEHIVKRLLIERDGVRAWVNEDRETRKCWDVETSAGWKYEIKTQLKAHEYGSVFIETMEGNELSGLAITKAHFWVNVLTDRAVIVPVAELRDFIRLHRGMKGVKGVTNAGFSGTAKGWKIDNIYFSPITMMGVRVEMLNIRGLLTI